MQIDYDPEADAIYIRLRDGEVDHTIESSKYIYVDVDANNVPLGLEILFAGRVLGKSDMTSITFNIAAKAAPDFDQLTPESQQATDRRQDDSLRMEPSRNPRESAASAKSAVYPVLI